MKTLYIIRHAKSSWDYDVPDDQRPLSNRGLRDAELIGEHLKTLVKPIDLVLSSPAERAYKTSQIVLDNLSIDKGVFRLEPDLYDFGGNKVLEVIKNCKNEINTLLIFGHNHAFTSIVNLLGDQRIDNLPTAGAVGIEFEEEQWDQISVGKIVLMVFPKSLR